MAEWAPIVLVALAGGLNAQTLVVDRGMPRQGAAAMPVERGEGKGFLGDSFRVGAKDEIWVLDRLRVWAQAGEAKSCPASAGDRVEKIVLLGALDNPPVPGQPACACHALVTIASTSFAPGAAAPENSNVKLASAGDLWQLDFDNLRWSLPGGMDVLFAVRATGRETAAECGAGKNWALSGSPAAGEWRLFTFNKGALEDGFSAKEPPRWFNVQVWGHRTK